MTRETFGEILAVLGASHGLALSSEDQKTWYAILEPLQDEPAKAAALDVARTHVYATLKPADIWTRVVGKPEDQEARLEEAAELGVRVLEEHLCDWRICNLGPYLNAVVRAMGGPDRVVALMGSDEWRFSKQEARRLFRAFRRGGVPADMASPAWPASVLESEDNRVRWRVDPAAFGPPEVFEYLYLPFVPGLPDPPLLPARGGQEPLALLAAGGKA